MSIQTTLLIETYIKGHSEYDIWEAFDADTQKPCYIIERTHLPTSEYSGCWILDSIKEVCDFKGEAIQ